MNTLSDGFRASLSNERNPLTRFKVELFFSLDVTDYDEITYIITFDHPPEGYGTGADFRLVLPSACARHRRVAGATLFMKLHT